MYPEEPDDDYRTPEQMLDAGWISEDVVERIRELLKQIEYPDPFPRPGSRSDAAMILIEQEINPPSWVQQPGASVGIRMGPPPEDPNVTWAKHLLKDLGLY